MELGIFTKDKRGVLTGDIITEADIMRGVTIVPAQRQSEGGPDYRVIAPTGADFGAGWNRLSADGVPYVSIKLQGVQFNDGRALYPILIENKDGAFTMAWEPSDPSKPRAQRPAATPGDEPAPALKPAKK